MDLRIASTITRAGMTAIGLVSLGAGTVACGGEETLTRAEYVEDFERLCAQAEADTVALEEQNVGVESGSAAERQYIDDQAEISGALIDGIKALRPPSDFADDHTELVDLIEVIDDAGVDADLEAAESASDDIEALISEMGITGCT